MVPSWTSIRMRGEQVGQTKTSHHTSQVEVFRSHHPKVHRKSDSLVLTQTFTINSNGRDLWLMCLHTRKRGTWMWSKWLIICARVTSGSAVPLATFTRAYDKIKASHLYCSTNHFSNQASTTRLLLCTILIWKLDAITAETIQPLRLARRSSSST